MRPPFVTQSDGNRFLWMSLVVTLLAMIASPTLAWGVPSDIQSLFIGSFSDHVESGVGGATRLLAREVPARAPITLRSVVEFHQVNDNATVHLAGFGTAFHSEPDFAALIWAPNPASWFGTVWSLKLRVGKSTIELANATPVPGHRYETYLSYDAHTGSLSFSITDLTDGQKVHKGGRVIEPNAGERLVAIAGLRTTAKGATEHDLSSLASVTELGIAPVYIPVGSEVAIGNPTTSGRLIAAHRFDLDEELVVQLTIPGAVPADGSIKLSLTGIDGGKQQMNLPQLTADNRVTLRAADLPLGTLTVHVAFVDAHGRELLTGLRTITVGHVRFVFEPISVDKTRARADGAVELRATVPIQQLGVHLNALLYKLHWDATTRTYVQELQETIPVLAKTLAVAPQGGELIPFSVPIPGETGLWNVVIQPSTSEGTGVEVIGSNERWFSQYPVAMSQPGESFTIAVLPDTQLYTWSHPTIFTRQTEWIAANAAQHNIGLVLHLGDVTEMNRRHEWERARTSMGLLDGVVPYVLSVGNHDLIAGSYDTLQRQATLINEYFPVAKFPQLEGTFEAGRIDNTFHTISLGGADYLVVSLEYAPRDEVLDWANGVVLAHPDHKVIVVTHTYLARVGTARVSPSTSSDYPQNSPLAKTPGETVNDGEEIWHKFIRHHKNIFLVLSGHIPTDTIRRRVSAGLHFNPVYELLADFQAEPNGGNGWLVLLEFTPDQRIVARTYSPYLGEYKTTVDEFGFDNHFIIDVPSGRFHRAP